jgi:FtsP/CotA-like multicopper oxidase with cupredoxin domain
MKMKEIITLVPSSGAAVLLLAGLALAAPLPGGTLDPLDIPKFVTPLVIPPAMPRTDKLPAKMAKSTDYYEIAVREIDQQILPTEFESTKVWAYGSVNHPGSFNYPAYSIEAKVNKPVRVKWINDLIVDPVACAASMNKNNDPACNYLPHFLPVDQTLHWANPPENCIEGMAMTDCRGDSQAQYTGPVPMIAHLHGAHVGEESDGYPEAWYLPAANNIAGFAPEGGRFSQIDGVDKVPGQAVFQYPNDQRATTLWFHDHSLGMTRLNVYAGPTGFYLLRGGPSDKVVNAPNGKVAVLPGPAPALGDPRGMKYYEIPIVIQDRSFNDDGGLFYPDNRAFFEGLKADQLQIPFIPDETLDGETSDVSPRWNPEFFGNTLVVNGKTWPSFTVDQRQYRFRFLNGSDSRFLILKLAMDNTPADGSIDDGDYQVVAGRFWQIGADGGFLPAPVQLDELLLGPAERADIIINFKNLPPGSVYLVNVGPDEPFGGGTPGVDFDMADPATTGQVMHLNVLPKKVKDPSTPVADLILPAGVPLDPPDLTRKLSLNEDESGTVFVEVDGDGEFVLDGDGNVLEVSANNANAAPFGPTSARLGTIDAFGMPMPMDWMMKISENPALDSTEVWEIYNFTMDAHPIHIHQVQFEVIDREALVIDDDGMTTSIPAGYPRGPEPGETGTKDTVIVYPGELARVKMKFDLPGLFVWHCHILSHEDNEMMRPVCVGGNCQ